MLSRRLREGLASGLVSLMSLAGCPNIFEQNTNTNQNSNSQITQTPQHTQNQNVPQTPSTPKTPSVTPLEVSAGNDASVHELDCVTLNGSARNGVPPYNFSWLKNGEVIGHSESIEACPENTTIYSFIVSDSQGTRKQDDVKVNVIKGTGVEGFTTVEEIFQNRSVFDAIHNLDLNEIYITPMTELEGVPIISGNYSMKSKVIYPWFVENEGESLQWGNQRGVSLDTLLEGPLKDANSGLIYGRFVSKSRGGMVRGNSQNTQFSVYTVQDMTMTLNSGEKCEYQNLLIMNCERNLDWVIAGNLIQIPLTSPTGGCQPQVSAAVFKLIPNGKNEPQPSSTINADFYTILRNKGYEVEMNPLFEQAIPNDVFSEGNISLSGILPHVYDFYLAGNYPGSINGDAPITPIHGLTPNMTIIPNFTQSNGRLNYPWIFNFTNPVRDVEVQLWDNNTHQSKHILYAMSQPDGAGIIVDVDVIDDGGYNTNSMSLHVKSPIPIRSVWRNSFPYSAASSSNTTMKN